MEEEEGYQKTNDREREREREECKRREGRECYQAVSRPLLKVCYITICLSRLDVKLGYERRQIDDSHKDVTRDEQNKSCLSCSLLFF